jgi:threonylcarbamoyladenosine tRNA methylthiotransferase MtaB
LGLGYITTPEASLLAHLSIPRLRLSSLEPWDLEEGFFDLWTDPALCPHLHLPLQSGSASVLARMNRKITLSAYENLLTRARSAIPGAAITTDIIVGFPGETAAEFDESLAFVRRMEFAGGHVFTYSARPGTAAASMPGRIHGQVARERSLSVRAVLTESGHSYRKNYLGCSLAVLWEATSQYSDLGWKLPAGHGNGTRAASQPP